MFEQLTFIELIKLSGLIIGLVKALVSIAKFHKDRRDKNQFAKSRFQFLHFGVSICRFEFFVVKSPQGFSIALIIPSLVLNVYCHNKNMMGIAKE